MPGSCRVFAEKDEKNDARTNSFLAGARGRGLKAFDTHEQLQRPPQLEDETLRHASCH